jgi:hypothetical protein
VSARPPLFPTSCRYVEAFLLGEGVANANAAVHRELIAMVNDTLRQRPKARQAERISDGGEKSVERHPAGDIKHGGFIQLLRLILFIVYNMGSCVS